MTQHIMPKIAPDFMLPPSMSGRVPRSLVGVSKADIAAKVAPVASTISSLDDSKPVPADAWQPILSQWGGIYDATQQSNDSQVKLAAMSLHNAINAAKTSPDQPGRVTALQMTSSALVQALAQTAGSFTGFKENTMFGEAPMIGPRHMMPPVLGGTASMDGHKHVAQVQNSSGETVTVESWQVAAYNRQTGAKLRLHDLQPAQVDSLETWLGSQTQAQKNTEFERFQDWKAKHGQASAGAQLGVHRAAVQNLQGMTVNVESWEVAAYNHQTGSNFRLESLNASQVSQLETFLNSLTTAQKSDAFKRFQVWKQTHGKSDSGYDKPTPTIAPAYLMPSDWSAGARNAQFASSGAAAAVIPAVISPSAMELKQSQFNPLTKQIFVNGAWNDPNVLAAQGKDYVVRLNNGRLMSAVEKDFPIKIVDQSDYDPITASMKGFLGIGWTPVTKVNEGVWIKLFNGTVVSPDQMTLTVAAVAGDAPWNACGDAPDNSAMMRWYRQQVASQQRQKIINENDPANYAGHDNFTGKTVKHTDPDTKADLEEPVSGLFPLEEYLKALSLHGDGNNIVGTSHVLVSAEEQADVPFTVHIIVDTDMKGNVTQLWQKLRENHSVTVEDRDPTDADLAGLARRTVVNIVAGLLSGDKSRAAIMAPLSPIVAEMASAGDDPDNSAMMRWYRQQVASQQRQKERQARGEDV